jgi:hypothetical protein
MFTRFQHLSDIQKARLMGFIGIVAIILIGGLRFSDGSMLLAISRGASITDPVFENPLTHYVWDSPLKVYLLWALPASIVFIGIFFALLGSIPALGLFLSDRKIFFAIASGLLLTPAFKVSIQNLGVGDGLQIALVFMACLSSANSLVFLSFLLIGLWHPQQAFFIGFSWALGNFFYKDLVDKRRLVSGLGGLAIAAVWFLYFKYSLGFDFAGRGDYLLARLPEILLPNLLWAPVAFLPGLLWFIFMAPRVKGERNLLVWLVLLASVSILTTDVTRVFTLISLPLVVLGAYRSYELKKQALNSSLLSSNRFIALYLAVLVIPPYSWSGLDFFLWGDLLSDLCKWKVSC